MASKPTLYYFPFAGRGELTRLIAAAGGTELEAGVVPADAEEKRKLCESCGAVGTGLPVLVHGDMKISQSQAIQQYVNLIGPKFSSLKPQARAVDMMWAAHFEDSLADIAKTGIFGVLFGGDASAFKPEELKAAFAKWFDLFERLSPEEGFVNKESFPTGADCVAVLHYEAAAPFLPMYAKSGFDINEYPKYKALAARAAAAPGLKEYVESSTTLKANPFAK